MQFGLLQKDGKEVMYLRALPGPCLVCNFLWSNPGGFSCSLVSIYFSGEEIWECVLSWECVFLWCVGGLINSREEHIYLPGLYFPPPLDYQNKTNLAQLKQTCSFNTEAESYINKLWVLIHWLNSPQLVKYIRSRAKAM